jgi:hypothetical protein
MCNARTSSNDQTLIPRYARGGSFWINLFGRDWIVRRRRPTTLGIIGTGLGCLGVMGITWGSIQKFDPMRIGIAFLVIGVMLICFKKLETKNLAADEIFNVGRERGEAEGYEMGHRDGVAEGERKRPRVVVPFPKCPGCGHSVGLHAVGSVADRG